MTQPALFSSESNEWYTPAYIIELVKATMGDIDLDPASCKEANKTAQAKEYYDMEVDGMTKEWHGRVFLNPPYGQPSNRNYGAGVWFSRLLEEYIAGRVTEAIAVGRGDSYGFRKLLSSCSIFCMPKRINFIKPGSDKQSPVPGTHIIYLGAHEECFAECFSSIGELYIPWSF